ncbi:MAG: type 2 isopentenyl-diphosphate Delta-isomerase [Cyanophyceae cyanobacterium]
MGESRLKGFGEAKNSGLGTVAADEGTVAPDRDPRKTFEAKPHTTDSAINSSEASHVVGGETQARKATHLKVCLEDDVQCESLTTGLERYRFRHCCLPELGFEDLDCTVDFLGHALPVPLLISSMTGGTDLAQEINRRLARAAQAYGLAMGVGSQRVSVERPETERTFAVRSLAPDAVLLANLGAVQLNYSYGVDQCRQVVDTLEANVLILHLNPLQEAVQSRGDRNFVDLLPKIEQVCAALPVPVIAKEVGNGISGAMARALLDAGVAAIDVAGAGGTSWAQVESARAEDPLQRRLGRTFRDWGYPTAHCVTSVREVDPEVPLIASGGLRTGLDAAKVLALGADLAGLAMPFLKAAAESEEAIAFEIEALTAELKTAMFCAGCKTVAALRSPDVLQRFPKS